jgi:hypothetical protein
MNERRTSNRIKVGLKALFHEGNTGVFNTKITNISTSGLHMETPQFLRLGTDINIDIDAENIGSIMSVFGHVVRITQSGVAIEFTHTDKPSLDRLLKAEKYMASKIKPARKTDLRNTLLASSRN